jgi:hypothetical protein
MQTSIDIQLFIPVNIVVEDSLDKFGTTWVLIEGREDEVGWYGGNSLKRIHLIGQKQHFDIENGIF